MHTPIIDPSIHQSFFQFMFRSCVCQIDICKPTQTHTQTHRPTRTHTHTDTDTHTHTQRHTHTQHTPHTHTHTHAARTQTNTNTHTHTHTRRTHTQHTHTHTHTGSLPLPAKLRTSMGKRLKKMKALGERFDVKRLDEVQMEPRGRCIARFSLLSYGMHRPIKVYKMPSPRTSETSVCQSECFHFLHCRCGQRVSQVVTRPRNLVPPVLLDMSSY